jgi:hypothetical protein
MKKLFADRNEYHGSELGSQEVINILTRSDQWIRSGRNENNVKNL